MHGERRGRRVAALFGLVLMVLVGTAIGFAAYNAGVSHGLALGAHAVALEPGAPAAPGAPAVVPPPYAYGYGYGHYGWHPWGFGFGFLGPLFFILFWFFILRMLFWRGMFWGGGGPWHRHRYGYGRGCYDDRSRGFDEWHRRAHERMGGEPPAHL
jgi:hypothetical protein